MCRYRTALLFVLVATTLVAVATPAPAQQGFKVHISVDMEGVAGVVSENQTSSSGRNYAAARTQMIAETNAAIAAAFDAGAAAVVVVDSHGDKTNLEPARLDRRATLIAGGPRPLGMIDGIDDTFAAAVFIGYHARASSSPAILDHTYNGAIKGVWMNDIELGEGGLAAAVAGQYGVPVVFVSGDRAVTEEMAALLPGIGSVAVKEAISRTAAHLMHPDEAVERIREGVRDAVEHRADVTPLSFDPPVTLRIEVADSGQADQLMFVPGMQRAGARIVEYVAPDAVSAYRVSRLARLLAQ
ncbi:MAG: M55 family metallopeptidase [Acidobacteriota bacterium]|jgi:D-amino peptidase